MFGEGEKRDFLEGCLDEFVARLDARRIERVPASYQPGRPEDSHPTASQHVAIAKEIALRLRERLGW